MPSHFIQRAATPDERALLARWRSHAPTAMTRIKEGLGNALVYWAIGMLAVVILSLAAGWSAKMLFGAPPGFRSVIIEWTLAIGTAASAVFAAISSARWMRNWRDDRSVLRDDVHDAVVVEEHYTFTAAMRFQEPEHGGLIYFLRAAEDTVFTVFDHESQDLGVEGKDPLQSPFHPRTGLRVVRASKSRFVLHTAWSGERLPVEDAGDLAVDPADWPEPETLCDIPWSQLGMRLGHHGTTASR